MPDRSWNIKRSAGLRPVKNNWRPHFISWLPACQNNLIYGLLYNCRGFNPGTTKFETYPKARNSNLTAILPSAPNWLATTPNWFGLRRKWWGAGPSHTGDATTHDWDSSPKDTFATITHPATLGVFSVHTSLTQTSTFVLALRCYINSVFLRQQ